MPLLVIAKSPELKTCHVHSHDCWELILNLSGEGREVVGDEWQPFSPGSVTLCPPHMAHNKYLTDPDGTWQDVYLRFSDPTDRFPLHPIRLQDDPTRMLERLVLLLMQVYHRSGADSPLAEQLFEALCTALTERIFPKQSRKAPLTDQINAYIEQNYANATCDIRAFLSTLNYAPDYIRRVYKRDMSMTPLQYLTHLRIDHARMLLRLHSTPHYSISEVALLSGFDDVNYFTRLFRSQTGCTPSQYRK